MTDDQSQTGVALRGALASHHGNLPGQDAVQYRAFSLEGFGQLDVRERGLRACRELVVGRAVEMRSHAAAAE